jgi:hypothetical protein
LTHAIAGVARSLTTTLNLPWTQLLVTGNSVVSYLTDAFSSLTVSFVAATTFEAREAAILPSEFVLTETLPVNTTTSTTALVRTQEVSDILYYCFDILLNIYNFTTFP